MHKLSVCLATALLVLPLHAEAQVAGSSVSGLDARIVHSEVAGLLSVQAGATLLEGTYRVGVVPDLADIGLRIGALSSEGDPTTLATGVDMRIGLMSADHPSAPLPIDLAVTAGVGAAFPRWEGQLITIPFGLSIGGELPFETGIERPSSIRVYAHPRVEHSRQIQGDCTELTAICQRGWVFRSDVGVSGDLSERARWYAIVGLGDTRYTGTGFALGIRAAW